MTLGIHGVGDYYSNAIVGDSKGEAIEIFYCSCMVIRANQLLRRRCEVSGQFLVLSGDKADIPQPHCDPWSPATREQDHIFGENCSVGEKSPLHSKCPEQGF
jgi:hypothetical protein